MVCTRGRDMDIARGLDDLRAAHPACSLIAFGDISARMILCASGLGVAFLLLLLCRGRTVREGAHKTSAGPEG